MAGDLSLLTLRSLYAPIRENPHEKKAKTMAAMMPHSGFASPIMAGLAGRELSKAESWDVQREEDLKASQESAMKLYQERTAQEGKMAMVKEWVSLAKSDPELANIFNEKFNLFPGVNFKSKITKDGTVDVTLPKNEIGLPDGDYKIEIQGFFAAMRESDPQKKKELLSQSAFPIVIKGKGKPLQRVQKGSRAVYLDEENREVEGLGGAYFKPKEGGGGGAEEAAVKIGEQKQVNDAIDRIYEDQGITDEMTLGLAKQHGDQLLREKTWAKKGPNIIANEAIRRTILQMQHNPEYNLTVGRKPKTATPAEEAPQTVADQNTIDLTLKILRERGIIK